MQEKLDKLFNKNADSLAALLGQAMEDVLKEYDLIKQTDGKGEPAHIYISFLLSSVLCELPLLRIDVYDETAHSDMASCFTYLDMPVISGELYRDAEAFEKEKGRIKDYERAGILLMIAGEYSSGFEKHLLQIIEKCDAAKQIDVKWHFGQFLGNTSVLGEEDTNIEYIFN